MGRGILRLSGCQTRGMLQDIPLQGHPQTAGADVLHAMPQTPEKVLKELHIQLWHKGLFHTKEEDTCLIILAVGQQEKPLCPCPQLQLGTRSCTVPAAPLALPGAGFLSAAGLRQCERGIHSAVQSLEVPDVSTQWSALPAAQGPHEPGW